MLSDLIPRTLEVTSSPYNRKIEVIKFFNGTALFVNGIQQSGPYFEKLWQKVFSKLFFEKTINSPSKILLLGLGGGTIIKIIKKLNPPGNPIFWVIEIDRVMIDLAQKHFAIQKNKNLHLLIGDARKIVKELAQEKKTFDLVITDLYLAQSIPAFLSKPSFLKKLSKLSAKRGRLIFNFSVFEKKGLSLEAFTKNLQRNFIIKEIFSKTYNRIIICQNKNTARASTDLRQTISYAKYMSTLGWAVETIKGCRVFYRSLPFFPYFSVIKVERANGPLPFAQIDYLARKTHAVVVKIQPNSEHFSKEEYKHQGYIPDSWSLMPTKTITLDLRKSQKTLFRDLSPEARYKLKKIKKHFASALTFIHLSTADKSFSSSLDAFIEGFDEFSRYKRIYSSADVKMEELAKAFKKNVHIFLLEDKKTGNLIWGLFVIKWKNIAYYLHTFSSLAGKKISASYYGLWQTIKYLQDLEMAKLDLEGVFDERFPKLRRDWRGLTQFKLDWGGKTVYYPQSYTKYYNPFIKFIFRIFS